MSDLYFDNVSLLLHCNGSDASTTFTDTSGYAHTVSAYGNAQIDTAQSKFGGASALFDGTGDYLSVPDAASLDFDAGDFTIEFWVRFNIVPGAGQYAAPFGKRYAASSQNSWSMGYGGTEKWYFSYSTTGTASTLLTGFTTATPSASTWYHIAFVRSASSIDLYINGERQISKTISGALYNSNDPLIIGAAKTDGVPSYFLNGWLDEIRITKGVARYTSNFMPAEAEFEDFPPFTLLAGVFTIERPEASLLPSYIEATPLALTIEKPEANLLPAFPLASSALEVSGAATFADALLAQTREFVVSRESINFLSGFPLAARGFVLDFQSATLAPAFLLLTRSFELGVTEAVFTPVFPLSVRALTLVREFAGLRSAESLLAETRYFVANINTLGASEYTEEFSDALAVVYSQEKTLILTNTGVFEHDMGSPIALPATAYIQTGALTLGADTKKFLPEIHATLASASETNMYVLLELDGRTIELGPYALVGRSGSAQFVRKWRLAGGVKADSLALRLVATSGTDWQVAGISAQVTPL